MYTCLPLRQGMFAMLVGAISVRMAQRAPVQLAVAALPEDPELADR